MEMLLCDVRLPGEISPRGRTGESTNERSVYKQPNTSIHAPRESFRRNPSTRVVNVGKLHSSLKKPMLIGSENKSDVDMDPSLA